MSELNPATKTARQIVHTLVHHGVRDVVLCPGSRSAPLAFALADAHQAGWLNLRVVADERSAAYIALGIAKLSPAAVVTTSGTAVANLHPATLEATHSGVPLILITADRPHHMRGVGANQTTQQTGIFGPATRAQADIPTAEPVANHLVRLIAAATGKTGGAPGPVHLNIAFADPLPPPAPWDLPDLDHASLSQGQVNTAATWDPIEVSTGSRGVIVAGDTSGPYADEIARGLQWPILAEPSSGVRHSPYAAGNYHRTLATHGTQIEEVLVFGRPTLTRDISKLLARTDLKISVVSGAGPWPDVAGVAAKVSGAVEINSSNRPAPGWLESWLEVPVGAPQHWGMAAVMWQLMTAPVPLFIGSSLPIRAADAHGPVGEAVAAPRIWANRGLAGIDGNVATATGLALKNGSIRAVMGDVTFAHDAMSLMHGIHEQEVNLQVVVIDNDGGKIFETLEYGAEQYREYLPRIFNTQQRIDIAAIARGVGAEYLAPADGGELAEILAHEVHGRSVIHVRVAR